MDLAASAVQRRDYAKKNAAPWPRPPDLCRHIDTVNIADGEVSD